MAHDYATRTIDYTEDHPPEWATMQEKVDFYPKHAAKLIVAELRRVEAEMAAKEAEEAAKAE